MLEIKNVTKIYKSKGGVETKALDDVSISFGETGLVFLLGKSGSGKSTLLNVSGGLDEPSSGEVIVKGKSSKEFSGSDFDSYRNTFVGFIFQEYNILDEFNVEDNIALALELQGKPKDREKIAGLLKDVDLEAYAKRKPNTLSGGQKQRIAIARALVKDPQIIMADEPTGALDSNTGKQVFDTLKKLSETRLVIVVSHDREFAEIYGDRIVELKDGKIISDVSKSYIAPEQVDENVSIIGENTLSIKSGASLTKKNIKTIQDFILNTQTDVIVTKGEAEIKSFKKAARMGENGETERFNETGADAVKLKEYTKEDSKFIRSRLPAAKAIKIGASGLKLKPVRLVFTILLSFIAFTMFGLFSTLMVYDGDKVASKSFAESGIEYLNLNKSYAYDYGYDDGYLYSQQVDFTPDEYESLKKQFGDGALAYYSSQSRSVDNVRISGNDYMSYYRAEITSYTYVPENHAIRSRMVSGKYPVNDDEICISSYFLDVMKNSKFYNATADGQYQFTADYEVKVNGVNDVLGKYLVINLSGGKMYAMKICGVFDSGEISSDFDELKANSDNASFTLAARFNYELTENMHQLAFVSESYLENYPKKDSTFNRNFYGSLNLTDNENSTTWIGGVSAYGEDALPVIFNRPTKDSLADDEIIISADYLNNFDLAGDYYENQRDEIRQEIIQDFEDRGEELDEDYLEYAVEGEISNRVFRFSTYAYALSGRDDEFDAEYLQRAEREVKAVLEFCGDIETTLVYDYYGNAPTAYNVKIVGVFTSYGNLPNGDYYYSGCYFSENFIKNAIIFNSYGDINTRYEPTGEEIYAGIILPYDGTEETYNKLAAHLGEDNRNENDVYYVLNSFLYSTIQLANETADLLKTVFLWVGIVFAVFAALLMFNFISVSISNKRKEIGILRAVGARGVDVFKIFFSEAGIISGICTVLSLVGTFVLCIVLNGVIKKSLGLGVSLFVFGFASIGIMLAIAVVTAFIATFLPVFLASRKKPVDSIRAL